MKTILNVLVACERSGVVRRAFRALGHSAWSCDLVAADDGEVRFHIQGDALEAIRRGRPTDGAKWDLLVAHPPCTYLCNSGVRWLAPGGVIEPHRHEQMKEGADFFAKLLACGVKAVAGENPVMHGYARDYLEQTWRITRHDAKPTQTVQPWQFGDDEKGPDNVKKRTCFWLRGLPPLHPTGRLDGSTARPDVHFASPGPDRARKRSQSYPGMAKAMAEQWSAYLLNTLPPS